MKTMQTKIYLYLGLSLPILTLAIFMTFALIGQYISPPLQSVLFIDKPSGFKFFIKNNTVFVKKDSNLYYKNTNQILPNLIEFNPTTQTTTEYPLSKQDQIFTIPSFKTQRNIDISTSIDGYTFKCHNRSVLFFLFIDQQDNCTLSKKPFKNIKVHNSTPNSLFLGWIENE